MPKVKVEVPKKGGGTKTVTKHLPYPSGRAGGYRAPVDTAGMDPEMKRTLEIGRKSGRRK